MNDVFVAPDEGELRAALGQFATGVTIITTLDAQGAPIGFTANSFSSVSLEPPLLLWSLGLTASSLSFFSSSTHYAVNVLASEQIALSRTFSTRGLPQRDRFRHVRWQAGNFGVPILEGTCAWFECTHRSRYEEGDHVIFVGEILRLGYATREPLIFQNGSYHRTQPHPDGEL